jgi:endonuclease-3
MNRTKIFLKIFKSAEKKYRNNSTRLAAEEWKTDWQILISTIMSAQSRDETTIPIAEKLFEKYDTLKKLSNANYEEVLGILKSMNYNRTKSKHVIEAANFIIGNFKGKIPDEIDELVKIPGVGRKTANLVLTEVHNKDGITVDTHVHRISNVLGLVETKTPNQTEKALRKVAPKKYWSKINRIFVLWGKEVPGKSKEKLLRNIGLKI